MTYAEARAAVAWGIANGLITQPAAEPKATPQEPKVQQARHSRAMEGSGCKPIDARLYDYPPGSFESMLILRKQAAKNRLNPVSPIRMVAPCPRQE